MLFVKESFIPAPAAAVFAFHERPDALQLLIPPWEKTRVLQPPSSLAVGTVVRVKTRVGPLWALVEVEHTGYEKGRFFEDTQRKGPFAAWRHRHIFLPREGGTVLRDEIEYAPPLGPLGRLADPLLIRPRLERMFRYRHEVTLREVMAATPSGARE